MPPRSDLGATVDALARPPARPPRPDWGYSLAQGAPGIALLHIERARAGLGRWETAHEWATAATRTPVPASPGSGLFLGAPAVAFALTAANQPGYADALRILDSHITGLAAGRLRQAHQRIDRGQLPALREYDLISGLTGIGCYLLHHHPDATATRDVLHYLVRLTHPLRLRSEIGPGWWSGNDPTDQPSQRFPRGHGNLGMAHGIAGPLALLSTAMKRGITIDGHHRAITTICAWLDRCRHGHDDRAWWPEWTTTDEHHAYRERPPRPSWCYGTAGQARALQLAGQATGDTRRQRTAERALLGCITNDRHLAELNDASLCHGWAGLVQTVWRAAADARTGELAARLPHLRDRLVHHRSELGDKTGFLDGHDGAALALHTTATDTPPPSAWDACLLIHG